MRQTNFTDQASTSTKICVIREGGQTQMFFFQHTYFSEHFIRALARLSIWNNTEHKLDQVDHILETEGAETKLVLYSLLCKMRNSIICNN